jgi:hypothetical protein
VFEEAEGALAENLDADLLQDSERGEMERLDLVLGQDLNRAVGIPDRSPGQLRQAAGRAAWPASDGLGGHGRTIRRPTAWWQRPFRSEPA